MKKILLVCLLAAVLLASGCVREPPSAGEGGEPAVGDVEASAYDQIEQEMEQAIEDIDLGGLEDELLV
jgi:hypothetical protein